MPPMGFESSFGGGGGVSYSGGNSDENSVSEDAQEADQQNTTNQYQNINDRIRNNSPTGTFSGGATGADRGDNDSPSGSDDSSTGSPQSSPSATTTDTSDTSYGVRDQWADISDGADQTTGTINPNAISDEQIRDIIYGDDNIDPNAEIGDTGVQVGGDPAVEGEDNPGATPNSPNGPSSGGQGQIPLWLRNAMLSGAWGGNSSQDNAPSNSGIGTTTIAIGGVGVLALLAMVVLLK